MPGSSGSLELAAYASGCDGIVGANTAHRSHRLALVFVNPCLRDVFAFDVAMFPYLALADEKSWQPGPYPGVELKILHRNEETGGVVVLRKFHAGHTIPAHTHALANEWAWVLSGEWEEDGVAYKEGTLFFAPKGVPHGPHVANVEVVSLTVFDGPLTVA